MNWDYTPCTLDAELFEECGCDDGFAGCECVGIEECTTDDGDENNGEATAEDLGAVSNYCTSCHGAKIGNDLGYGYGVRAKVVLVLQQGGIEILRAVGLEIVRSAFEKDRRSVP
jgi:hypothetical protein